MHTFVVSVLVAVVSLQTLVARHPLYPIVQQYDREIAALRATQVQRDLHDPAAASDRAADAVQSDSFAAQRRIESLLVARGDEFARREDAALGTLGSARTPWASPAEVRARIGEVYRKELSQVRDSSTRSLQTYRGELGRQTEQTLAAFEAAAAQTTQRALAARAQQFSEKESTLAFDLEKSHAGHRLSLALALADLRRDAATRAKLRAQIAALDASVASRVAQLHADDESQLAAYRAQLEASESAADAAMAQRLRSGATENMALRGAIAAVQVRPSASLPPAPPPQDVAPSVADRAASLRASYHFSSDSAAIAASFSKASDELSQRFADLANRDRISRAQVLEQIAALERARKELYDAIVRDVKNQPNGERR